MIDHRFMSFGTFSSNLQPNLRYGFPLSVKFAGMMMDIDQLFSQTVDKNNDRQQLIAYVASQGPRQSANEHLIPEQLFDDPNTNIKDAEAVSAVKALQLAAEAGQKIFTVTQANASTVLPQLQHKALIMEDVRNAVNAGKVVTISQSMVSYNGWTGVGYSIVDPNTGAGAWLIGGGMDGAMLGTIGIAASGAFLTLFSMVAFTGGLGALGGGAVFVGITTLILGLTLFLSAILKVILIDGLELSCTGALAAAALVSSILALPPVNALLTGGANLFAGLVGLYTAYLGWLAVFDADAACPI